MSAPGDLNFLLTANKKGQYSIRVKQLHENVAYLRSGMPLQCNDLNSNAAYT